MPVLGAGTSWVGERIGGRKVGAGHDSHAKHIKGHYEELQTHGFKDRQIIDKPVSAAPCLHSVCMPRQALPVDAVSGPMTGIFSGNTATASGNRGVDFSSLWQRDPVGVVSS
jgi:hypothetical protein